MINIQYKEKKIKKTEKNKKYKLIRFKFLLYIHKKKTFNRIII